MFKRLFHFLVLSLVVLSAFASVAPALADSGDHGKVEGKIAAVDVAANTVTITPKKGGADVVLSVDASTKIKRNGKKVAIADLQVGDKANAKYNPASMLASKIEAKNKSGNGSSGSELKGVIAGVDTTASTVTITPKSGGANVTLNVDANTSIKRNGKSAGLADLLVGDNVEAKYDPSSMLASKLEVHSASGGSKFAKVKGSIAAVDVAGGSVTVTPSMGGADVVLKVDSSTIIKKNDALIGLADLQVGDMVEAKYDSSTMLASKIEVKLPKLKGTISAIDTAAGTITVTPMGGGADMTFTVDANTVIELNDAHVSLSDLLVGDQVEVKYDAVTLLAFKIEANR